VHLQPRGLGAEVDVPRLRVPHGEDVQRGAQTVHPVEEEYSSTKMLSPICPGALRARPVGRHEAPARLQLAQEWFELLEAPRKQLAWFDTSGHRPQWEQPDEFHDLMTTVLQQTSAEPG
jgi:hypothetical protein